MLIVWMSAAPLAIVLTRYGRFSTTRGDGPIPATAHGTLLGEPKLSFLSHLTLSK